jgi:hypothetical protein
LIVSSCTYELKNPGSLKKKLRLTDTKLRLLEPKLRFAEPKLRFAEPKLRLLEPKLRLLEPKLRLLEPKLRLSEPKLRFAEPNLRLSEPELRFAEPKLRLLNTKIRVKKPEFGSKRPVFRLFRAKDGFLGRIALVCAAFFGFFERGVGLKGLIDDFVSAACDFGADVSDYYFAVFLSFHKGVDVAFAFFLCWLLAFDWAAVKELVKFNVDGFGGIDAAFGGVFNLRIVFEGVSVDHVGAFYVDVPRFFFEAAARVNEGADGSKKEKVVLELACPEPVREVLRKFFGYAERGFDEAQSFEADAVVTHTVERAQVRGVFVYVVNEVHHGAGYVVYRGGLRRRINGGSAD